MIQKTNRCDLKKVLYCPLLRCYAGGEGFYLFVGGIKMKKLLTLYLVWFKMGLFTFGGGYAMLPIIQREVVEKYHWATEDEIIDYYAIGQCTPGVIAVNSSTFVGYKIAGIPGGIAATLGVITPSLVIISLIAAFLTGFQDYPLVQRALSGIRISVCILMASSLWQLGKKSIGDLFGAVLCTLAFLLSYFTSVSTVLLVVLAGVCGVVKGGIRRG